ncbi:MAG: hypothetical protein HY332_03860 [Chloroflexi bacterium]|nr:hypothetical protein [Chloroflexota bacterium]
MSTVQHNARPPSWSGSSVAAPRAARPLVEWRFPHDAGYDRTGQLPPRAVCAIVEWWDDEPAA